MDKINKSFIGFESITDYIQTIMGAKYFSLTLLSAVGATLTSFITGYVYDSAQAVYFMFFLCAVDLITGILKSIKQKTFSSSRLPRMPVILLSYCLLLSISWNASHYSVVFSLLPAVVYGGLVSTLIVSIVENLVILGYIKKDIKTIFSNFFSKKDNNFNSNQEK